MRMLNPVHPGQFVKTEIVEAYNLSVTRSPKFSRSHGSRPSLSTACTIISITRRSIFCYR